MDSGSKEFFSEATAQKVARFRTENDIYSKGKLSLAIQFTRKAKESTFPLNAADFQTDSKGQVAKISGGNLKKILKDHGITRRLSSEGGRTSRGSIGRMMAYVDFLNQWSAEGSVPIDEIENYWAEEIRKFFNNQPFILSADTSRTVQANLNDLFEQAKKRERENKGMHYLGIILQHLVGAKLQTVLQEGSFEIHGASVADSPTDRSGDFVVDNTSIHCTTMPGDLLIEKCKDNLRSGTKPVIITIQERTHTAQSLLEDAGLKDRVEVWDIQQFLSMNIMEHSGFVQSNRNATLAEIIARYNQIIDAVETDPSLKIDFDA